MRLLIRFCIMHRVTTSADLHECYSVFDRQEKIAEKISIRISIGDQTFDNNIQQFMQWRNVIRSNSYKSIQQKNFQAIFIRAYQILNSAEKSVPRS